PYRFPPRRVGKEVEAESLFVALQWLYKKNWDVVSAFCRAYHSPIRKAFGKLKCRQSVVVRIILKAPPQLVRYIRSPFQCLNSPVLRQQWCRQTGKLLPLNSLRIIEVAAERNDIVQIKGDVAF